MNFKRKLVTGLLGLATLCGCLGACIFSNSIDKQVSEVKAAASTYIHFNKQGGHGGWDYNNSQSYGQPMNCANPLASLIPSRNGCTFLGYFDAPSGGTQYYYSTGLTARNWDKNVSETTLYAQWSPSTYLVTFDKQGGTGGSDSSYISNFDNSTANNDQITIPQNTGYSFYGYFDQPNGQGNQVYNSIGEFIKGSISTYSSKTLYAYWSVNHVHDNILFLPWTSNNSLPTSGSFYLNSDVAISANGNNYGSILDGNLNLCLNGHLIKMNSGSSAFYVGSGKTLNIYDCAETIHYYSFYRNSHWNLTENTISAINLNEIDKNGLTQDGTPIIVPGGAIVDANNQTDNYGGAILVDGQNAYLYLNGGNIIGNNCKFNGGGVAIINAATFTLNDGNIIGNSGFEGGGIFSSDYCNVNIENGNIAYNTAHTNSGGGIASYGSVTMNGGMIHSNATKNYNPDTKESRSGAGVYIGIGKSFAKSTFTLNAGTISKNYSGTNGGGVFIFVRIDEISGETHGAEFIMNGGTISENTANYGGGIENYGTFTMTGGIIEKNTASSWGGGIDNNGSLDIDGGIIGINTSNPSTGISTGNNCTSTITSGRFSTQNSYYPSLSNKISTITFDKKGGTSGTDSIPSQYWGTSLPSIEVPSLTGHTFLGYFNDQGEQYYNADGTAFTKPGDGVKWDYIGSVTLYAYWTVNSYSVALDTQGGTGGSTSITPTFDAEMPEITLPTRDYCDFGGYFTGINGDGIQYYNAEGTSARSWDVASDTTLYAYWIKTIENFSKEFLVKTTTGNYCDKTKGIDFNKSIQDDLFTSFYMVDSDGIIAFKNAEWVRGHSQIYENDIVEAKSRYCYMVVELGINDFLKLFTEAELKALMHRGSIVSLFNDGEDGTSIILVASLSILAITTFSAYILFRKRKEE